MTLVTIDLGDVAGGHDPDDHVVIRAENFREAVGGGITSTAEVTIPLVDGVGQAEVEPGPVVVSFRCRAVADTREKRGAVPASGTVGIERVLENAFEYLPPVVNHALETIKGAVAAEVDAIKWVKPALTEQSNLEQLTPGLYPVPTTTVATALGLPVLGVGQLEVKWVANGLYRSQRWEPQDGDAYQRTAWNGSWRAWVKWPAIPDSWVRGAVPAGVTPEDMTGAAYQGLWTYNSAQVAEWSIPSPAAGILEVSSTATSTLHQVATLTTPIKNFQRRWYNGTWLGDWETVGGAASVEAGEYATATSKNALNAVVPSAVDPTMSYVADHATLMAGLKARLGTVSTGGRAAVALVADHGTTAFKEWLWDAAKARNIPFTMALCPETHLDGKGDSRHTASNADIKQWISEGLSVASHSSDHGGALGYFDVARQIMTSKTKLEEKLGTIVDAWVQPGYELTLGNYDGFGTGQSAERYTDYYAGRLLQQTYPVITGYTGSAFVYSGNADLPVGMQRSFTERKNAFQGVKDYIQQAIDTGGKHVNFLHPYAIPESSDTYVTRTEYLEFLDWLVQKRDAGELVLLTLPELAIARPTPQS